MKTEQEIWKKIKDYESLYEVSNFGRIKSMPKQWIAGKDVVRYHGEIILNQMTSVVGYKVVNLSKNKKQKLFTVHRIMAINFLNHVPCKFEFVVDHIDNDKSNNHIDNLQIITNRENSTKNRTRKSKYLGVTKSGKKFRSRIVINGKSNHIGTFNCETKAYLEYIKKYNYEIKKKVQGM